VLIEFIRLMAPVITLTRSAPNLSPDLSKSVTRSRRDDAAAFSHGRGPRFDPLSVHHQAFAINDLEN
jgi:hypothetical protein